MGKMKQPQKLRIGSVRYIHDPDAEQEWFSLFIDLVQAKLQHRYSNSCPFPHSIEAEKEIGGEKR